MASKTSRLSLFLRFNVIFFCAILHSWATYAIADNQAPTPSTAHTAPNPRTATDQNPTPTNNQATAPTASQNPTPNPGVATDENPTPPTNNQAPNPTGGNNPVVATDQNQAPNTTTIANLKNNTTTSSPNSNRTPPAAPRRPSCSTINPLSLYVCVPLLNIPTGPSASANGRCCSLLQGLGSLLDECFCPILKLNLLGLNLVNVLNGLNTVLSTCGTNIAFSIKCA